MAIKKSWKEKLHDSKDLPKVVEIDGKLSKRWGSGTCVIPAPIEVDTLMKKVSKGKLVTINEIRANLPKNILLLLPAPSQREFLRGFPHMLRTMN